MNYGKTRWRSLSAIFISLLIGGGLVFLVDVFLLKSFGSPPPIILTPLPRFVGSRENGKLKGFLIRTEGCRIPELRPFDASIREYISKEEPIFCNNAIPPLIESSLTHLHLLLTSLAAYGVSDIGALTCCYSVFQRKTPTAQERDNEMVVTEECVSFNETVQIKDEYVKVVCFYNSSRIYKDFFAFVPLKPEIAKTNLKIGKLIPLVNVLIVGVDSVSRLNLHRQMPKTLQVLEDIDAIEFLGYNKVGENTFQNLIPVLTGMSEKELVTYCWPSNEIHFDNCPFIWKSFSRMGYATVFAEDAARIGLFNYLKRAFKDQPTNDDWGPFNYYSEQQIGNEYDKNVYKCVGSRMVYKTLLDYMNKFVSTMHINKVPYFGFFWSSSLSHDYLNKPKLADDDYADFLKKLRTSGLLNNTALIFMSDHGIRWGGIHTTYQGKMEDRLPFLFISLPESYRETYYQAYINLRRNSRRLTTPYDLHETLKDLLDPHALTNPALSTRIHARENKRGYGLFEPIPTDRTCDSAGIESSWCTCQKNLSLDEDDRAVVEAAQFTIKYINSEIEDYSECARLTLNKIYDAQLHFSETALNSKIYAMDYTILFRTTPGKAIFEATVRQYFNENKRRYAFSVIGTISRIDLNEKQSVCIKDFHLRLYCYCRS